MKRLAFVIAIIFTTFCYSQQQDITKTLDSIRALGLNNPSIETFITKTKQQLTSKKSNAYLEVLLFEAEYHSLSGNFEKVLIVSDSLINQDFNSEYKSQGYIEKGIIYVQQSKNDEALKNLKLALPIAKSNNDNKRLSQIFKLLGNLSFMTDNMGETIRYYKKSLSYSNKENNKNASGLIINNIARAYEAIDKLDSAIYYNNKNLKFIASGNASKDLSFTAYLNDADFQNQKDNFNLAKKAIDKAIKLAYESGNPFMIGTSHQVNSTLLKNTKNYSKASDEALKAIHLFDKIGAKSYSMQTQYLLQEYQALSGDYEAAYKTHQLYQKTKDSLNVSEADKSLKELRIQYETAERDLLIAQQESDIFKKESQKKTLTIITIALAFITLISFLFFKQRQKSHKQKIINLQNEKENIALKSLMAGEEKERSRIAKELHDGLGSILAAAKMHASNKINQEKVIELIDSASKESRRISHNLLPENLITKGLDEALKDFINSLNTSKLINASYQSINLNSQLPQSLQLSVYRIIQELLNNIIKHAEATEAIVQLQESDSKLLITVEDNGKGFANKQASKGIGLTNIESRLSLLKGELKIDTNEKLGTSVYIELKLDE